MITIEKSRGNQKHPSIIMVVIALLMQFSALGQNIIINSSFEDYTRDSVGGYMVFYNGTMNSFLHGCRVLYWSNPNNSSPDYLHTEISPPLSFSAPISFCGYQHPYYGEAYAHVASCKSTFMLSFYYREYIQGKLSEPLEVGKKYVFGFFAAYTEPSIYASKIGIGFTQDSVYFNTMDCLISEGFYPDLETDEFITDTANWTRVEWVYTAMGGERFFTVGNFWCDSTESFLFTDSSGIVSNGSSGYFLDDFYMYELIDTMGIHDFYIPNIFSPNGDGNNDIFRVRGAGISEIKTFVIYDRWGEEVFQCRTSTPLSVTGAECGWDGTYRGKEAPTAVYTYYVEAVLLNGQTVVKRGNVTLVR